MAPLISMADQTKLDLQARQLRAEYLKQALSNAVQATKHFYARLGRGTGGHEHTSHPSTAPQN